MMEEQEQEQNKAIGFPLKIPGFRLSLPRFP